MATMMPLAHVSRNVAPLRTVCCPDGQRHSASPTNWLIRLGLSDQMPLNSWKHGLATASMVGVCCFGRHQRRSAYSRRRTRVTAKSSASSGDPPNQADDPEAPRRAALISVVVGGSAVAGNAGLRASNDRYSLVGTLWPPRLFKDTLRTELVPGRIWGFEQVIGFFTVSANIRMTVVRLSDDTLWVSCPISPTRQCLSLLLELGGVAHLVVPGTALEHKVSLGDFSRAFPDACVWVSPGQSASLPDVTVGTRIDGILGQSQPPPWKDEIDYKVFFVGPPETAGTYAETAFFHRDTKTLLITDAVLKVPVDPPAILDSYGFEGVPGKVSADQWYYKFLAFNFLVMRGTDADDFARLARPKAVVPPLLRFTLYPICQQQAAAWVRSVAEWPFERVVAAHLQSPFDLSPAEFLEACGFLLGNKSTWEPEPGQLERLRSLSEQLDGPAALTNGIWTSVS